LLAVVTLAAVGSWAYWIGWPWWAIYREQHEFLAAVQQLKVGMPAISTKDLVTAGTKHRTGKTVREVRPLESQPILHSYFWSNATYCVLLVETPEIVDPPTQNIPVSLRMIRQITSAAPKPRQIVSIEVFRLPPVPNDTVGIVFQFDFLNHLVGDRKNNPGFKYELIYSDPPAKLRGEPPN
jgi:hypothetical protein